jgi:hypothetical protein
MLPADPDALIWNAVDPAASYATAQLDAALQALTLYLHVWTLAALAFAVLAGACLLAMKMHSYYAARTDRALRTNAAARRRAVPAKPASRERTRLERTPGPVHPALPEVAPYSPLFN